MKARLWLLALTMTTLAACGGGGGGASGGSSVIPVTPTSTPGPVMASVSGKLVDDSGSPVAGQPVAIASWSPSSSTYTPVATTDTSGNFSFSATPGQYLMRIGPDAQMTPAPTWTPYPLGGATPAPAGAVPVSSWQATTHTKVTFVAGTNVLVAPTMPPQPNVSNPAVEANGNYRMSSLSAKEIECVYVANAYRIKAGLTPFVVDQWLLENSRNYNAAQIQNDQAGTVGGKSLSGRNAFSGNEPHCTYWMAQQSAVGGSAYGTLSDPLVLWMGAEFGYDGHPTVLQNLSYGEWMRDPRTETSADPLYLGWL